jgi:DNA polymerase III epsilon subunit-like protein
MLTPKQNAIQQAKYFVALNPVYLDTETTGTDHNAQIVEICVLDADGRVLVDSLVKPTAPISPDLERFHGITNALVQNAPTWKELWPQLEAALTGRRVAIYNAEFDVRLMQQSHQKNKLKWMFDTSRTFCIMQLYAQFHGQRNPRYGGYRWQSLDDARQRCGLSLPNSHRAKADAELARAVLHYMASR